MSRSHLANVVAGADRRSRPGGGIGGWLSLAATPTFAAMALVTALAGGGAAGMVCSVGTLSPLSGMIPMYVLMSAFHAPPWLRLIFKR